MARVKVGFPESPEAAEDRSEHEPREPDAQRILVDRFHDLYYQKADRTWQATRWLGVPVAKCPLDLWIYQEILAELQPDVIIESGTSLGGSSLYLASICDLLDHGRIYSVDVAADGERPQHPRIEHLIGSSTSPSILADLQARIAPGESVLVLLHSDHARSHVLAELEAYRRLVTPGSYLIVEDTNVNGHPVFPDQGPGPWEAVDEFLRQAPELVPDLDREKFFLTFNPRGFLRKRAATPPLTAVREESPHRAGTGRQGGEAAEALPYDFQLDLTADNTYVRALQLVGTDQRVLELGCATGYVSRLLADLGCRVTAIERHPGAAAKAREVCELVLTADLETDDWSRELEEERFDVLLAMDVLEHLRDPAVCLRRAKRHLKPGGRAIVSVPNVAHGSVRLSLLEGRFDYQDLGLLDRTHLRFFTRSSVEELFRDAGYLVTRIQRVEAPIFGGEVSFDRSLVPPGLLDWLEHDEEARTYQFVVEAQPLAPGLHGRLQSRLAELGAENDVLRAQIRDLTRPDAAGEPRGGETVRLRAEVGDLRRRLAARQQELAAAREHSRQLLEQARALRSGLEAGERELQRLHEAIERQEEEAGRYVGSLRQHLTAKADELRQLHEVVERQEEEVRRYVGSLRQILSAREDELRNALDAAAAADRNFRDAERDLRAVHSSLWYRLANVYWRLRKRLGP